MPESARPAPPAGRPLLPLAAALWSVALSMGVMVAVSLTESARPGADSDVVNLAACQMLATSLVVFAMVRWHAPTASLRVTMSLRPIAPLHVLFALVAGAGLYPLMSTVDDLILARWPIHDAAAIEGMEHLLRSSSRAGLVVAALVVVPVARELFFRGIVYGGLRASTNPRTALLATALLYACSTIDPRQLPTAVALGLALGWLRERSGTVISTVLAQLAYGAVAGVPILLGRDPAADVTYPATWIAGGAVLAVLALGAVAVGEPRQ